MIFRIRKILFLNQSIANDKMCFQLNSFNLRIYKLKTPNFK